MEVAASSWVRPEAVVSVMVDLCLQLTSRRQLLDRLAVVCPLWRLSAGDLLSVGQEESGRVIGGGWISTVEMMGFVDRWAISSAVALAPRREVVDKAHTGRMRGRRGLEGRRGRRGGQLLRARAMATLWLGWLG